MKIKNTKLLRLDELIKYCIENDRFGGNGGQFVSTCGFVELSIYCDDVIITDVHDKFNIKNTLFTITEEIEITDNSILGNVLCFDCNIPTHYENKRFKLLKENFDRIYLLNEDETQYNLIYDKQKDT